MAFTKSINDADIYFRPNNHVMGDRWNKYTDEQKLGAFAQAKREIEVFLNRSLDDPASGDTYRDDYAVFEQALYLLENEPGRQDVKGVDKVMQRGSTAAGSNKPGGGAGLSPKATAYLFISPVKVVRG